MGQSVFYSDRLLGYGGALILRQCHTMPRYLIQSHSSRVSKRRQPIRPSHSSSSAFSGLARTKPFRRARSLTDIAAEGNQNQRSEKLDATGKIASPSSRIPVTEVLSVLAHSNHGMFSDLPERPGMNSTRIAEVLNFRKNLPPLMSLAHLHALLQTSTRAEREIAGLIAAGQVRKIRLSGRGNEISGFGELLITRTALEELLRKSALDNNVVHSFLENLEEHPTATSFSAQSIPVSEYTALIQAGFLVFSSFSADTKASLSGSALTAPPMISRASSGTWAAVGGDAAFENLGGVGVARRSKSEASSQGAGNELMISIPNIGPYVRLVSLARSHLVDHLTKLPFREAPLSLLRERWDGAVESTGTVSSAKRMRGEFSEILPGKTKKWKDLYGLSFDWMLEECLGAGLIELFETHSVGLGIRAL